MSGSHHARSHALRLGWLFIRTRPVRLGAVVVACAVALVIGLVIVTESLQASGTQRAAQKLGAADYTLRLDSDEVALGTSGSEINQDLVSAMTDAGAQTPELGYAIFGIPLDGQPDISLNMFERDWQRNPFPDRFTLLNGRFPESPGEVAVSRSIADELPLNSTASFFNAELRSPVVGTVVDNFSRSSTFVLAAPGSWDSMEGMDPDAATRYGAAAARELFWNGSATPAAIVEGVAPLLIADPELRREAISTWIATTGSKAERKAYSAPLFTELLLLLLLGPVTASLFSGWFAVRFLNRMRATMMTIGVYRTKLAGSSAVLLSTAGGAVLGCLVGAGIGFGIRPVINAFSNSVLGPVHDLFAICVAAASSALVGAALGLVLLRSPTQQSLKPRAPTKLRSAGRFLPSAGQLLPAVIVVLVIAGLLFAQADTTNEQFVSLYCIGLAAVLCTPYVLFFVVKLNVKGLAPALGLRRIAAEFRFSSWAIVALSALLMVSFALSTIYFSATASQNEGNESNTPPGQIHFKPSLESESQADSLRSDIEQYLAVDQPVLFSRALGSTTLSDGATLVFESVADIERVVDLTLTPAQQDLLADGGTLRTKEPNLSTVTFETAEGASFEMPAATLPGLDASFRAYDGLMLTSTADIHQIGSAAPTWAYTDVAPEQIELAMNASAALGFESGWLQVYEPPPVATEPIEFTVIALVIAALGGLVMAYYAAAAARALRPNLAALRALGMKRTWLFTTLTVQVGTILVVAVGVAALAAIVATATSLALWLPGVDLRVPWQSLTVLVSGMFGVVALSLIFSSRKLSMIERLNAR